MDTIKTATGKIFKTDFVSVLPDIGIAYIRIVGSNITDVAAVFSNPRETVQLWYGNQYLACFTRLDALIPEAGAIRVNLRKE